MSWPARAWGRVPSTILRMVPLPSKLGADWDASVVLAAGGADVELAADLAELFRHLGHAGFGFLFGSG